MGGFRAAAAKLNLTQPAISARIQILEQDLGASLFVRDVKRTELTPEGRRLFAYAERAMFLEQETLAAFSETTPLKQTIRLGSSETIVATWLPDFLGDPGQQRNGLSFELTVDSTNSLRNAIVNREIDLAFLMGPVSEASVKNFALCEFEMIFAATQPLASQIDVWTLGDIAQQKILTFSRDTRPAMEIIELLQPYRSDALDMTTSTALGALVRLASAGHGICAMPKAVISTELQKGALVPLVTDVSLPSIAFTASFVSSSPLSVYLSKICQDVSDFLKPRHIKNIYQT